MTKLQEVLGLNATELEQFRRISHELLSHTFILRSQLQKDGGKIHRNPDFLFVQRHFDVMYDYFALMDWALFVDDHNGYCYLRSESGGNRLNLSKDQTALFLCLRLLYDEKMEDLGGETDILISVQEILDKLIGDFGILKTYSKQKMQGDLSLALHYRLIQKKKGALHSTEALFAIMPTILTAVPSDRIHALVKNMEKQEEGEEDEGTPSDFVDKLATL